MVFVDEKVRFSYDVYSLNRKQIMCLLSDAFICYYIVGRQNPYIGLKGMVSQFDPLMRQQCSKILFNFSLTPSCDNI